MKIQEHNVNYDYLDECQICGCFIEQKYRLFCGHFFCIECLRGHLLESEKQTDYNCPSDGCKGKYYLIDMLNLLTQKELNDLFHKHADPYVAQFKGMYKWCPTTNCGNILFKKCTAPNILDHIRKKRAGKGELNSDDEQLLVEGGDLMKKPEESPEHFEDSSLDSEDEGLDGKKKRQFVFCECCGHDFCFDCMKAHYGDDCKQNDLDGEIIRAGILDAQKCPNCNTLYERIHGCQHMTCGYCKAHFCNLCFAVFKGDETEAVRDVYDHLVKVHGSITVDQPFGDVEEDEIGDIF